MDGLIIVDSIAIITRFTHAFPTLLPLLVLQGYELNPGDGDTVKVGGRAGGTHARGRIEIEIYDEIQ